MGAVRWVVLLVGWLWMAGCDRAGVTRAKFEVGWGLNMPAQPVEVDPRCVVYRNTVRRTHGGMDVAQEMSFAGPVKIVPGNDPWLKSVSAQAMYSSPRATYREYLEAVLAGDAQGAAACWAVADAKELEFAQAMADMWVACHRFNVAVARQFPETGEEAKNLLRQDCTDDAIMRGVARAMEADETLHGETAELQIKWVEGDAGSTFGYAEGPRKFRKAGGMWRMDLRSEIGATKSGELLSPGSWGAAVKMSTEMLNTLVREIETGKIVTGQQLEERIKREMAELEKRYAAEHRDPVAPGH